ncbi:YjjG family noncanonical pyrimidine nucleotidase [Litoribacter ruber]|uniref:YjjG family noncanonical pyrimidine nucleotidase n=1 Tax=Litoribacter ruber TaxID=702568 RepID=A0AAP2G1J2_9BACT|nr:MULTISPECIES: YjjG family noncanonical pyrimidine nucleotidase [Litoribacter]MBS9524242.1 YjjG family noncanonical pyrimidine nucleotidase [Litoribacter alkaliphilus]MBT0809960.1 YjjG family noncanonical pyrimidine nucleotidase [Litoribacter ruber]
MKTYHHIFFDLDHTLWDYDTNVRESLQEIFQLYTLYNLGVQTHELFYKAFIEINYGLWGLYNKGKIDKAGLRKIRFQRIFEHLGADTQRIPEEMEEDFMNRTSCKTNLFPFSLEVLDYLKKKYQLHIITNGFNESQGLKINSSGLQNYFDLVVTSETTGHRKPDRRIFEYALAQVNCTAETCIMIGDNLESDIRGAQQVNMDQIYFNPNEAETDKGDIRPTYSIKCLSEIQSIL